MSLIGFAIASGTFVAGIKVYQKQKNKLSHSIGLMRKPKLVDTLNRPPKKMAQKKPFIPTMFADGVTGQDAYANNEAANENGALAIEKTVDRYFKIALGSWGLTIAGALFYSPLTILALPGLIYPTLPIFKDAYHVMIHERKLKMSIVDAISIIGIFASRSFIAAGLITSMFWFSKKLLLKAEDRSRKNLVNVFTQQPRSVWLCKDGSEIEVPLESLEVGDTIVVQAGGIIPADGTIIAGYASIDQRILTGEAQPVEKEPGAKVLASTMVLSGQIYIKVEQAGETTVVAHIGEILNRTADFKQELQWQWMEFVDKTALPTLAAGVIGWPLFGPVGALGLMYAFGFGYNMRVVAPFTLLNFLYLTTQHNILIKDGRTLESLPQVDTIVFDKTGTLTEEQPTLAAIYPFNGYSETQVLTYAAAAETKQSHPIALAIQEAAKKRGLVVPTIEEVHYEIGYGLKVQLEDKVVRVGSARFMTLEGIPLSSELNMLQERSHEFGYSLVCLAVNGQIAGALELKPTIRPEAKQIINDLRARGLDLYMISGDHTIPTQKLAEELGIEHYFAETLPENKAKLVEELQKAPEGHTQRAGSDKGKFVCFVGDGINDALALQLSDVSISLRGASSIATDTAQIVLLDGSLQQLPKLFELAENFSTNMQNNFLVTVVPNAMAVGGVLFLHFGLIAPVLLSYTATGLGVGSSMLPLLQEELNKDKERSVDLRTTLQQWINRQTTMIEDV